MDFLYGIGDRRRGYLCAGLQFILAMFYTIHIELFTPVLYTMLTGKPFNHNDHGDKNSVMIEAEQRENGSNSALRRLFLIYPYIRIYRSFFIRKIIIDNQYYSLYLRIRMEKNQIYTIEESARLFKALADPVRLRIAGLLLGEEICVHHIHKALNLPQSTVSRHLAYLKKCGLVKGRSKGTWIYYRLAKPKNILHRKLKKCFKACFKDLAIIKEDKTSLHSALGRQKGGK